MYTEAIAVFTCKSLEHILRLGGTASWTLNRAQARRYPYVVCARNSHHKEAEGDEPHQSAFLVAKIKDVVPSPENPARWMIAFSEYAEVTVPDVWRGWRNPVRYTTMEELGIDTAKLTFKPMTTPPSGDVQQAAEEDGDEAEVFTLTIAQAKLGLANAFGVPPEAIEITIRG